MIDSELSYQIYSEFKDSDWYIYWDKEYSRVKKYQILVVWFAGEENYTYYDYVTLKALLKANKSQDGLQYVNKLSQKQIKEFIAICEEFCMDIELEFGTKD